MTFRTLIGDILQDVGYLGVGDTLLAEDANDAMRYLNQWINSLVLEPLALFYVLRSTKVLASSTASLTVGTGGDINITRPDHIKRAGLIISNSATPQTEVEIDVYTDQEYDRLPQKTLTSPLVMGLYYDRNWVSGLGTIKLFPVPNVGTTSLVIYTLQALGSAAFLLDDDVSLPNGYELMFRQNGVVLLAPSFGKSATPDQIQAARLSKGIIKRANIRPEESSLPAGTPGLHRGAVYDWRTDSYR